MSDADNADKMAQLRAAGPGEMAGKWVDQAPPPAEGELAQTMREIEGPYYRLGAPERSDLLEDDDTVEIVVSGRVLTPKGVGIPRACISVWFCDRQGNYDMIGHRYHGWFLADEQGNYEFRSILPTGYAPRFARHYHVKVQGNSHPITTQLYIEGDPKAHLDKFYADSQVIRCTTGADGVLHGSYDFVLAQVSETENVTPESLAARV